MAWALVGSLGTVAHSGTPTFGQSTTAGNTLIAWLCSNDGSATNPFTETGPTGWTILAPGGASGRWVAIAYKMNCAAGETAPTFHSAGAPSNFYTQLGEFSGGATSSIVDSQGVSTGGSVTITATNAASDTVASDLIVFCGFYNGSNTGGSTSTTMKDSNGATVTPSATTGTDGAGSYYDFAYGVAGATLGSSNDTATATQTVFCYGSPCIASFKAAASGYTVTFNANGGTGSLASEGPYSVATALSLFSTGTMAYTGYAFTG